MKDGCTSYKFLKEAGYGRRVHHLNFSNEFTVTMVQEWEFIFGVGQDLKSILNLVEERNKRFIFHFL